MNEAGIEEQVLGALIPPQLFGTCNGEDSDAPSMQHVIDTDQVDGAGDEQNHLSHIHENGHSLPALPLPDFVPWHIDWVTMLLYDDNWRMHCRRLGPRGNPPQK